MFKGAAKFPQKLEVNRSRIAPDRFNVSPAASSIWCSDQYKFLNGIGMLRDWRGNGPSFSWQRRMSARTRELQPSSRAICEKCQYKRLFYRDGPLESAAAKVRFPNLASGLNPAAHPTIFWETLD